MGLPKNTVILPTLLSPLGKACSRMDLAAVHEILLKTGYRDEEGAENEVLEDKSLTKFFYWFFSIADICLSTAFVSRMDTTSSRNAKH